MAFERSRLIPIRENVTLIDDAGEATCYLICGKDRALLVDTANGEEDLRPVVRSITDLPVTVVNTHGHPDHIFGNQYFDHAHLHPADLPMAQSFIDGPFEINPKDFPPFKMMQVGDVFDLGGVKLEVVDLKGHTPGSIGLLDRKARLLYTGDAINTHLWMQLECSLPIAALRETLLTFRKEHGGDFDFILHGHAREPLPASWLDALIVGCDELLAGQRDKDTPYHYFGETCLQHPVKGLPGAVIVYGEDKL